MQEAMKKIQSLIDKYEEQLAANGIKITVSKHYFETKAGERYRRTNESVILNDLFRERDRRKEKENGYRHVRNRYHCAALSVIPIQKDVVRCQSCKEYAFMLKTIEREHIGIEPTETTYEEQKILSKIEKRTQRILRKAQKYTPQKVCQDTLFDALRYTFPHYGYKQKFLNKNRGEWELIFAISFCALALAMAFTIWLLGKLS